MVPSPEPYVGMTVTLNLNRALPLAATWQTQWLANTLVGLCTIRPDVRAADGGIQAFDLVNAGILRVGDMGYDGEDPLMSVTLRATYYINNDLWQA